MRTSISIWYIKTHFYKSSEPREENTKHIKKFYYKLSGKCEGQSPSNYTLQTNHAMLLYEFQFSLEIQVLLILRQRLPPATA